MLNVNNIYAFKKLKDKYSSSRSIGIACIYNAFNTDAGKLRRITLIVFFLFSMLILADYFLTVFAINQHFNEFNPVTVSIWKNFQNPEIVFLLLKIFVVALNGFVLYLLWKLSVYRKYLKRITIIYLLLIVFFAFSVVVYDIGVITGAINIEDTILILFFKTLGMI